MNFTTKRLVKLSLVAAIYVVMTLAIAPLSYGPIQFRISEVLNLLAFIHPVYGVAVTLGCFIANWFTPNLPVLDLVFGTLATAISVFLISKSKNLVIASLYPTIINAIIVGWIIVASITGDMMFFIDNISIVESDFAEGTANKIFLMYALSVGIGEFAACTVIGVPFFKYLQSKQKNFVQMLKDI